MDDGKAATDVLVNLHLPLLQAVTTSSLFSSNDLCQIFSSRFVIEQIQS